MLNSIILYIFLCTIFLIYPSKSEFILIIFIIIKVIHLIYWRLLLKYIDNINYISILCYVNQKIHNITP